MAGMNYFLNRNPRTKLPMILIKTENTSLDEYVRNRDSEAKYTMKTSAGMKDHAVNRGINVSDTVVVKRHIRENKLDPKFDMEPRTVINKKGPMLTVSGDITRNVSRFKKVSTDAFSKLKEMYKTDDLENDLPPLKNIKNDTQKETQPMSKSPSPTKPVRRSTRETKLHDKFKDFVLK